MSDDTHPCHDCGEPYFERMGSYWLADDALWKQVVGTDAIVLCPECFARRALAAGAPFHWQAVHGTGLELPGYDPDVVRVIPDDEHLECFAKGCGEKATIVALTRLGKGAFCPAHGEILRCIRSGHLDVHTEHWLAEAFLMQALAQESVR